MKIELTTLILSSIDLVKPQTDLPIKAHLVGTGVANFALQFLNQHFWTQDGYSIVQR